jgi:hypothetical protein
MNEPKSRWIWMMWLEANPKNTPLQTLAEACQYFTNKYGCSPTHARVPINWPDLNGSVPEGLQIECSRSVLPRHVHLATDPETLEAVLAAAVEKVEIGAAEVTPSDVLNPQQLAEVA